MRRRHRSATARSVPSRAASIARAYVWPNCCRSTASTSSVQTSRRGRYSLPAAAADHRTVQTKIHAASWRAGDRRGAASKSGYGGVRPRIGSAALREPDEDGRHLPDGPAPGSARERRTDMAQNGKKAAGGARQGASLAAESRPYVRNKRKTWSDLFSEVACATAIWTGKPLTFLVAALLVIVWALTGPIFSFSDTWQLVINTSTTIVTFLMVFLIQHTQNRDTLALQLKLAELIIAVQGAKNNIAVAEDLTEDELERLHDLYRKRAEQTQEHLESRRGEGLKQAS